MMMEFKKMYKCAHIYMQSDLSALPKCAQVNRTVTNAAAASYEPPWRDGRCTAGHFL